MICVYRIDLPYTGVYYIGYTADFYRRRRQHIATLKRCSHDNHLLQAAYGVDPEVIITPTFVDTLDEAIALEKELIIANKDDPKLMNIVHSKERTIEWRESHSRKLTGRPLTMETRLKIGLSGLGRKDTPETIEKRAAHRRKRVLVHGQEYKSITDAALATGTPRTTLLRYLTEGKPGYSRIDKCKEE